jgi:protein TonB
MSSLKARPSITASLSSDRRASGAAGSLLTLAAVASLLVHTMLVALAIWQPKWRVQPVEPEIPAQIELQLGTGAERTGAPPPPAAPTPQPAPKPAPPSPPISKEAGYLPPPPPQTVPAPPAPRVAPEAVAGDAAEVHLGDGNAAPPAEVLNPLAHVEAAPDPANIAPEYPPDAARRREAGTVVVNLHINAAGRVESVELLQSSGSASLDRATIQTASRWHYRPAFHDGAAVPTTRRQIVNFVGE